MKFSDYVKEKDLDLDYEDYDDYDDLDEARDSYIQNQSANDVRNNRRINAQRTAAQSRQDYQNAQNQPQISPAMAALQAMRQNTGLDRPTQTISKYSTEPERPTDRARFGQEYWAARANQQQNQTTTQTPNSTKFYTRRYARPGDLNLDQPLKTLDMTKSQRDETLPKNPVFGSNPNNTPNINKINQPQQTQNLNQQTQGPDGTNASFYARRYARPGDKDFKKNFNKFTNQWESLNRYHP